jgi:hypothetical protein
VCGMHTLVVVRSWSHFLLHTPSPFSPLAFLVRVHSLASCAGGDTDEVGEMVVMDVGCARLGVWLSGGACWVLGTLLYSWPVGVGVGESKCRFTE